MAIKAKRELLGNKENIVYIMLENFALNNPKKTVIKKFLSNATRRASLSNGISEIMRHEYKKETLDKVRTLLYEDLMTNKEFKGGVKC